MDIKGIAWDFNGVIVDDEILHYRAFALALAPRGVNLSRDEYWKKYLAHDDKGALEAMATDYPSELAGHSLQALHREKIAHYKELAGAKPPVFPGAIEAIKRHARYPMVIVSGARREEIETSLEAAGISHLFRGIVASEDVRESKPDPEPYLRGIEMLGLAAGEVVAVEDSVGGIESAKAAGLYIVAVEHTYSAAELQKADKIVRAVAEINFPGL